MGRSFCTNCWKEFETAGPELHAPDCQYMLVEAYYIAGLLGYKARDEEPDLPKPQLRNRYDRSNK
jgi:hypothetical protein